MTEAGPGATGGGGHGQDRRPEEGGQRIGNPTRLIRRPKAPAEPASAVPEVEVLDEPPFDAAPGGPPVRGGLGPLFAPRSFGGGRVQVWGCSPGCLVVSLIASVLLTILLNVLL